MTRNLPANLPMMFIELTHAVLGNQGEHVERVHNERVQ